MMIDLKTLYEQTTLYAEPVDNFRTPEYYVEVFHQLHTPIYIFAYWEQNKLHSIAYTIREDLPC